MFAAVRQWWTDGRGKPTARLFAFEFIVVMFGVLAAQAVADWAQDRNAERQLDLALERVRRDAGYNMAAALVWQRAAPCLAQRMTEIMQSAADGGSGLEGSLRRPKFRFNYFDSLSEGDDLLLRERGGNELADSIAQINSSVDVMAQRLREIADRWTTFELLDQANGPVMREDRVEARHNASVIRANLAGIQIGSRAVIDYGQTIGAVPIFDPGERLPRDCSEIWRTGQTMITAPKK